MIEHIIYAVLRNIIIMEKPVRKPLPNQQKQEERVSTAPSTQRNKLTESMKIHNIELPLVRCKMATKEGKRSKREEVKQHEHEEIQKRPQTSKGSRASKFHESEYYEDEGDDLMLTTKQQKIDMFKKKVQQPSNNLKH